MKLDNNYFNVHKWLRKNFGSASLCENKTCVFKNLKRYEYALIHGRQYVKVRKNFLQLCVSCHRKYDCTEITREKMRQRIVNGFRPSSSLEARRKIGEKTRERMLGTKHTKEHIEKIRKTMQGKVRLRGRDIKGKFISA